MENKELNNKLEDLQGQIREIEEGKTNLVDKTKDLEAAVERLRAWVLVLWLAIAMLTVGFLSMAMFLAN